MDIEVALVGVKANTKNELEEMLSDVETVISYIDHAVSLGITMDTSSEASELQNHGNVKKIGEKKIMQTETFSECLMHLDSQTLRKVEQAIVESGKLDSETLEVLKSALTEAGVVREIAEALLQDAFCTEVTESYHR